MELGEIMGWDVGGDSILMGNCLHYASEFEEVEVIGGYYAGQRYMEVVKTYPFLVEVEVMEGEIVDMFQVSRPSYYEIKLYIFATVEAMKLYEKRSSVHNAKGVVKECMERFRKLDIDGNIK